MSVDEATDEIDEEAKRIYELDSALGSKVEQIENSYQSRSDRECRVRALCRWLFKNDWPTQFSEFEQHNSDYSEQALLALADIALDGAFHVQRILGKGATATAFLVEDINTTAQYCFKLLNADTSSNAALRNRLLAAARKMKSVHHRNIASIIRVGQFGPCYGILQEYIDGVSLHDKFTAMARMDVDGVVDVVCDLARALQFAQEEAGLVHRDVSPSNVILSKQNIPVIIDFDGGLSPDDGDAEEVLLRAAFPFASPEQIEGRDVDHRTDIFSLGVNLYFLLTRKSPFQTREQLLSGTAPFAHSVDPYVPKWLSLVCHKCLQRDREHRYQSAAELIHALRTGDHVTTKQWWKNQLAVLRTSLLVLLFVMVAFVSGGAVIGWFIGNAVNRNSATALAISLQNDWDETLDNETREDFERMTTWLKSNTDPISREMRDRWLQAFIRRSPNSSDLDLIKSELPEDMQIAFFPDGGSKKLTLKEVRLVRYRVTRVLNLFESILDAERFNGLLSEVVDHSFRDSIDAKYSGVMDFVVAYRKSGRETAWIGIDEGLARKKAAK